MPSASSGHYQSRLFKFFHSTARRFTQQCDRAFRHFQYTASGVAATVLYPFYWLFQSPRGGKQFNQAAPQGLPKLPADDTNSQPLTPPTADTPIRRVLLLVDDLRSAEEQGSRGTEGTEGAGEKTNIPSLLITTHHPQRNRAVIQGIATQLSSRNLVLVTAQNEILDVLTPEQQENIQEWIIEEVAEYWSYQRILHSVRQKFNPLLQVEDKETRGQGGQGETLATRHSLSSQALAFLARVVATLESKNLARVSKAALAINQRSRELVRQLQTKASASLSRGASPAITPSGVETQALGIQALIWAAVDYFFGERGKKHLQQATPTANSISGTTQNLVGIPEAQGKLLLNSRFTAIAPNPQQVSDNLEDPWLTHRDLFGDSSEANEPTTQQSELSNTQAISPGNRNNKLPANLAGDSVRKLLNRFQKFSLQPKPASGIVKQHTTKGKSLEISSKHSPAPEKLTQSAIALHTQQPQSESTQIEPAPDWIEINATTMGYVKHPLEQLLEWLDRAMLWLEEVLINVWHWVQRFGRKYS